MFHFLFLGKFDPDAPLFLIRQILVLDPVGAFDFIIIFLSLALFGLVAIFVLQVLDSFSFLPVDIALDDLPEEGDSE